MPTQEAPTVDVRAPDGRRIMLRPAVPAERLPGLSRQGLAAVAVLSAVFLLSSVVPLNHTDLWGHLSFGRWIVQHGRLPETDPFRSFVPAKPVVALCWLAQVLGYLWEETAGLEGLVLAHAALVTLATGLLLGAIRARGVPLGWAAAGAAASFILALPVIGTIRPQLFGNVGLAAVLCAAAQLPDRKAPLVWLAPLFALWANLHGSFAIGLAVLGCLTLGQLWEARRTSPLLIVRHAAFRRTAWACVLAAAACCLNPSGVELLWHVARFSGHDSLAGISEWRPMGLDSLSGALFFGSLAVTALLAWHTPRRITALEALLVLGFGVLSLLAIRMLVWWAMVWPWVVAPHVAALARAWRKGQPAMPGESGADPLAATRRLLVAGAVVLLTLWWSPPTHALVTGRARVPAAVLSPDTPIQLADQLVQQHVRGRIFAPLDWADYLVWRTDGAVEPLVHGHVHLTTRQVWQDFLALQAGSARWLSVVDRYGLEYLVIRESDGRALLRRVEQSPRCHILGRTPRGVFVAIRPESATE